MSGTPTLSKEYIYSGSTLLVTIAGASTTYHHPDHLSNRAETDVNGTPVRSFGHFPFGETWYETAADKLKFTSYENDSATGETGLNYALFRYHAPGQGRFMSPDKMSGGMSAPQSLNRYSYTTNDPVNGIDSLGLYTITVCTVFGHIVKHETSPTETIIDNVICTTFSLDFGLFGGTGGGGGGVGEVTDALKRLKKLLDPKCITFLNSKGVDALGYIDSLIQFADQGGIAVKDMPGIITGGGPEKNAGSGTNTILSIDHAVTGHDGVPLTVNGLGAFFNKTYGESKLELTTDHGKINGGGIQAQLFIMLHEVAHGTEVIQPDKGNQPQINANDDTLEKECKDTVKSIKKEK